jgi:hypothetical protein
MNLYLLPETETREDGAGPAIETSPSPNAEAVVTLGITQALEREGLQVSIWGSPDGESWGPQPLAEFPAKSYCGRYTLPLNLNGIRKIRAAWKMRNHKKPDDRETFFGFYVEMSIPAGMARAATA